MIPRQIELTWPAFARLREKWQGRVELQGVCLVTLSYFRDHSAAVALADVVAAYGGVLGAAVCCSDIGGLSQDDWTTCEADRLALLDTIFVLAAERGLLLDFHVGASAHRLFASMRAGRDAHNRGQHADV